MVGIAQYIASERNYLKLLYSSIFFVVVSLIILIVTDPGLNTIGEPFHNHLMAVGIAISRLTYDITGLAGLDQILDVLRQIKQASIIPALNSPTHEFFNQSSAGVNEIITKALHLHSVDTTKLYGYENDIGYLYYVLLAFRLFGIKIQSLMYLWILFFLLPIIFFVFSYKKNVVNLVTLWMFVVSIFFVVIANPGVGKELQTIYNMRFLPVLGLIPLLHVVFALENYRKSILEWLLLSIQALFLVFIVLARGSAQWMFVAISVVAIYFAYNNRKCLLSGYGSKLFAIGGIVTKRLIIPFVVVFLFLLAKNMPSHFLHKEYKKEIWSQSHAVWHNALIGMAMDPSIMNLYVCSQQPLVDRFIPFYHMPCIEPPGIYQRVANGLFSAPDDMLGYHAAVRYLRDRGLDELLGTDVVRPGHFNMRWDRYEQIVREIYFDVLKNNPIDAIYIHFFVKPLRYFHEAFQYIKYFGKGVLRSPHIVGMFFILVVIAILHFFLKCGFHSWLNRGATSYRNEVKKVLWLLFFIFISSLVPSMIFYCTAHTIADSVVILLTCMLFASFVVSIKIKFLPIDETTSTL